MPPPSEVPTQLTDRSGVEQVMGRCGVKYKLDADRTGVVSAAELEQLTFCINYGSELVWAYCGKRYSLEQLQRSWLVYWWSSTVAAYLLSLYRCGSVNAALQAEYEAAVNLLVQISLGIFQPASMNSLSGSGTALVNVRYDPRYRNKTIREQVSISDGPRAVGPQRIDIPGVYVDSVQWDYR